MPDPSKLLAIYLNDHLAGATAGRELSKRAAGSNRDNDFGLFLERLHGEIVEDRETLLDAMRRLGAKVDPVKCGAAVVAERAGRLKLNGSLRGYSPLSRVVELEALAVAVNGKRSLWSSLRELRRPELEGTDLDGLHERAVRQHEELEQHKQRAATIAFGGRG